MSNSLALSPIYLIFISLLFLTNTLQGQEIKLLYPLKYKPSVSSSFGTFRNSHHHAGLDLYAYETTPVIASADGTISLMKRSSSAYGRVLYINHENGYQTVYGHLSAFAPRIDQLIREEEKKTSSFKIKMYGGKRLSVKAGELIGWAGTAGTDLVHLHYELRKNNLPINPLTNGLKIPDQQAPQIKTLYLQPKTTKDWINGGQQALEIDLTKDENKVPHFEIWGDIRLAAQIEDTIDGSERTLTPYEFYLEIDGKKYYHIRHEENSYAEKGFTKYDFDLRYRGSKPRLVNRLYAYGPRFRQQIIGEPTIFKHLKLGKHTGKIIAKDANGNKTESSFTFEIIKPLAQACLVHLTEFKKDPSLSLIEIKNASFNLNGFSFPILDQCENEHSPIEVAVKINGTFEKNIEVHASKSKDQKIALTLSLDKEIKGKMLRPNHQNMDVEIGIKAKINGVEKIQWFHKKTFWFTAHQSQQVGDVRVQMMGKPLEEFVSAVEVIEDQIKENKEIKPLSPLYQFHNPHQVTNGYYKFWIKRGKTAHGDHTGAFVHQEGKLDWGSLGWHTDELSGYAGHLGEYILLEDLNAPIAYPPLWLKHPAGPRLIIPFREKGSEISKVDILLDGKPISCEYQKSWQRFVFHPTSVIATPKPTEPKKQNPKKQTPKKQTPKKQTPKKQTPKEIIKPYVHFEYEGLSKGKHTLQITVKDRTGHLVSESFEFEYPPIKEYESTAQWPWEWWAELEKIYENHKPQKESVYKEDHQERGDRPENDAGEED
jgi:hypothetical protein